MMSEYFYKISYVFLFLLTSAGCAEPRNISVTVVNDQGDPLPGVTVKIFGVGYSNAKTNKIEEKTDMEGKVEGQLSADHNFLIRMKKDGYYESVSDRLRRDRDHHVTYSLRKIGQPIPLVALKYFGQVPRLGKPCGFDFQKADWVKPHGKGEVADLFFTVHIDDTEPDNLKGILRITFANEKEGAIRLENWNGFSPYSKLTMPNLAPEEGYQSLVLREYSARKRIGEERGVSYFFRTRMMEKGGEVSYHYSKFHSGFTFHMRGDRFETGPFKEMLKEEFANVSFTYYYNPELGNRNLEFEPGKSLLQIKDRAKQVFDP